MQEQARQQLARALGVGGPPPLSTARVVSSEQDDGFVRQLVTLVAPDGNEIPAYLAVPPGQGPFPGIVVLHQHRGERHLGKSEPLGLAGAPLQAFGPALARAGFVVLAPDSIAFEDRRAHATGTEPHAQDAEGHYNALAYRLVMGDTLARKVLADAMAAVSALIAHAAVDPDRVGALGHSYGGSTTLFLAAVDPRVRYACASGSVCSYRRRLADGTGIELAQVVPGFAERFDIEDLLAAVAPRPFLVVSSTEDRYSADASEMVSLAAPAFAAAGAPDALEHLRVEGPHDLDEARFGAIVDWVTRAGRVPPQ